MIYQVRWYFIPMFVYKGCSQSGLCNYVIYPFGLQSLMEISHFASLVLNNLKLPYLIFKSIRHHCLVLFICFLQVLTATCVFMKFFIDFRPLSYLLMSFPLFRKFLVYDYLFSLVIDSWMTCFDCCAPLSSFHQSNYLRAA